MLNAGLPTHPEATEMRGRVRGCCRASLTSKIEPDCSERPFQRTAKEFGVVGGGVCFAGALVLGGADAASLGSIG